MKTAIHNLNGEQVGEIELNDVIFGRPWNPDLVHQALRVQMANQRRPIAQTKGRGEVSGGGRKPWRQKGTGRARHGSIRSPLWIGGGVAHGPTKEKIFARRINKKMARAAVHVVLSRKLAEREVKIIDAFPANVAKTKEIAKSLQKFLSALVVRQSGAAGFARVVRNIKRADAIRADALNVHDLLRHKNILIEKSALPEIR